MIENYDKAMTELQQLKEQIQETRASGKVVEFLQSSDSMDELPVLSDIFEHYAANVSQGSRKYPEPLERILGWFNDHTTAVPEELRDCLMDAMAHYEKQWFINGFRYATGIWKTC